MKIRPTRILVWLVLAGVAAAFYFALQPKPQEADFAKTVRGPLRVTLAEEGETRVRERYMVSAPVMGRVLRITHEPGDEVEAGKTVLARFLPSAPNLLDPRALAEAEARVATGRSAIERAKVDLDQARAQHQHATTEQARHQKLFDDGLLAEDRMESARLRAETARESVRAAESNIVVARAELASSEASLVRASSNDGTAKRAISLRSPITGVVLQRLRESEAVVQAGDPLVEVADPEELEIVSDMLSTDAVQIDPGDRVLIEQWGGDRTLAGTVRLVEPYGFTKVSALGVEEQRVNVIVDFDDVREAWDALGDGYRVEIRVVIWEQDDVLKVPSSSLFRQGGGWAVYVVETVEETMTAALREVEVGQRNALEAQILDGLQVGDQVIAFPSDTIQDGTAVVVR